MDRRNLLKSVCGISLCSCCAALAQANQDTEQANQPDKDSGRLRYETDFMRKRFASLVQTMSETLDEKTMCSIFEAMGRKCAREFNNVIAPYKGRPEAFLESIQKQWVESARFDKEAGTIRIVDKSATCTCPFVDKKMTPSAFCNCTIGWQKQAYETVFEKKVDVKIEESILKGGKQCIFKIDIKNE